jgi:hypothetical protein
MTQIDKMGRGWGSKTVYFINVKLPNLDLKLGIKPKAGNFFSEKREGEGGRERERLR